MNKAESLEHIFHYHEATKHHFHKFANSLGYLNWENQPNPFRIYKNCQTIQLPFLEQEPSAQHADLYLRYHNPLLPFTFINISAMIELSLSISAWKSLSTSKWALRINPSSGNLHPTESYWILPALDKLHAGIYHYNPLLHALALRATLPKSWTNEWKNHYGSEGFFCALSNIYWREAWKYGERAFRYCHHDTGHALAAISFAANLMGWQVTYLSAVHHNTLEQFLGFDQTQWVPGETENADLLCWIHPHEIQIQAKDLPQILISQFSELNFQGTPEPLSKEIYPWDIIETVSEASHKSSTLKNQNYFSNFSALSIPDSSLTATQIIRQRRSAVDFDPALSIMSREHFMACLSATLPRANCAPFDVELIEPSVHLFIFVHNVTDIVPGLYVLVRNTNHDQELRTHIHPHFVWKIVQDSFPLYLLQPGNFRKDAMTISCQQNIAGASAFSLGMVARFREIIETAPYIYPQLFWETGMIGQVLYLQAEAYGLRATGIGCFFDDALHQICGFQDNTFQSLYHFTIGYPIEDPRLSTLLPYHHLKISN